MSRIFSKGTIKLKDIIYKNSYVYIHSIHTIYTFTRLAMYLDSYSEKYIKRIYTTFDACLVPFKLKQNIAISTKSQNHTYSQACPLILWTSALEIHLVFDQLEIE